MKKLLKIFNTRNSSTGFTLIELLIAASITTIVVGLTGTGMVSITQNNKKAKAETERRVELNRALDFIADEIRQAKPIATDASANLATVAPGFNPASRTPVLTLQIPGVSQRVIYYIASPESGTGWLGPKVIFRWGPAFGANGNYTTASVSNEPPVGCGTFAACNPRSWDGNALVDLITDTTPTLNPACSTDWTPNPPVASRTGFYTCVDPTGRVAEIHLRGKLTGAYGNSTTPLEVSTKAFARPYAPSFTTGPGGGPPTGPLVITEPSTAYFEVLGGDVACSPTAKAIPTTTTINYTAPGGATSTSTLPSSGNRSVNLSALAGTTLTVTGILTADAANNSCDVSGSYNSVTHNYDTATSGNKQVMTLRNGDTPPLFNPYGGGKTIEGYLKKYINPTTGKVALADNQVIFLFELVSRRSTDSYYDMQDQVVLATIVPQ